MKTWGYQAITEKAEKQIQFFMGMSRASQDEHGKRLYAGWAYGVFLGWKDLTTGWMEDGDLERLEQLTKNE